MPKSTRTATTKKAGRPRKAITRHFPLTVHVDPETVAELDRVIADYNAHAVFGATRSTFVLYIIKQFLKEHPDGSKLR